MALGSYMKAAQAYMTEYGRPHAVQTKSLNSQRSLVVVTTRLNAVKHHVWKITPDREELGGIYPLEITEFATRDTIVR